MFTETRVALSYHLNHFQSRAKPMTMVLDSEILDIREWHFPNMLRAFIFMGPSGPMLYSSQASGFPF